MHLKNCSLLTLPDGTVQLAPAYDLVATRLALSQDPEESALAVNGKKNRLQRTDFETFAQLAGIPAKAVDNTFRRFFKQKDVALKEISRSFLSEGLRREYAELLRVRCAELENF